MKGRDAPSTDDLLILISSLRGHKDREKMLKRFVGEVRRLEGVVECAVLLKAPRRKTLFYRMKGAALRVEEHAAVPGRPTTGMSSTTGRSRQREGRTAGTGKSAPCSPCG